MSMDLIFSFPSVWAKSLFKKIISPEEPMSMGPRVFLRLFQLSGCSDTHCTDDGLVSTDFSEASFCFEGASCGLIAPPSETDVDILVYDRRSELAIPEETDGQVHEMTLESVLCEAALSKQGSPCEVNCRSDASVSQYYNWRHRAQPDQLHYVKVEEAT